MLPVLAITLTLLGYLILIMVLSLAIIAALSLGQIHMPSWKVIIITVCVIIIVAWYFYVSGGAESIRYYLLQLMG